MGEEALGIWAVKCYGGIAGLAMPEVWQCRAALAVPS
jgi:hypothetical protein